MIQPLEKTCETCSNTFLPASNRQKYCAECGRRGGLLQCEVCGTSFQRKANTSGQFCSQACWGEACKQAKTRPCEVCGTPFYAVDPNQRGCSRKCGDVLRRKERPTCATCGQPVRNRKNKYCSKRCSNLGRAAQPGRGMRVPEGSRRPAGNGYVLVKVGSKWLLEHRVVMAQTLGRPLEKRERIHHKNGTRDDNRPENLELWTLDHKDPAGVRAVDRQHCPTCTCFLEEPSH